MGVLECHQLTPSNAMVELKTHELCVKNQVEFMVQLEWVDVEFVCFFFLPNLHPLTLMAKKLGSPCQDMNPGPQGVRIQAKPLWTGFHVLTRRSKFSRMQVPVNRVSSPCQDMKPGPRELAFQKNLDLRVRTWNPVHRANWYTTISTTGPIYAISSNFYAKLNVSISM